MNEAASHQSQSSHEITATEPVTGQPREKTSRRRGRKTVLVAFKVEQELARVLDQLPNKSDFIRRAIIAQLNMACPLCEGTGVLPRGLHDHYVAHLREIAQRNCERCGRSEPLPASPAEIPAEDRPRLEQFFFGGPFYCHNCYDTAPACDDCGWHIAPEQARQHQHEHKR